MSVELGEVNKNKKTRIVLKLFGSDSLTLGDKKLGKFMEKVMEFEELKPGVRTLLWSSVINIQTFRWLNSWTGCESLWGVNKDSLQA